MAGNDTLRFYYPWPAYGVKMSRQWPNVRENFQALAPLVRAAYVDLQPASAHDAGENDLSGWAIGERDFRNKFRIWYDKTDDTFKIQYNNGTEAVPAWNDAIQIRESDLRVTVTGAGGVAAPTGGFYTDIPRQLAVSQDFALSTEWQFTHNLNARPLIWDTFRSNYQSIVPQKVDVSDPNKAYFYFSAAVAGTAIAVAEQARGNGINFTDGSNVYYNKLVLNVSNTNFYFSRNLQGNPVLNLKPVDLSESPHDTLLGLLDDDHPQYALTDGSRVITGPQVFGDSVRINEHIEVAGSFYSDTYGEVAYADQGYLTVTQTNGAPSFSTVNKITFERESFYITADSEGKPVINFRGASGSGGGSQFGTGITSQSFSAATEWAYSHALGVDNIIWGAYDDQGEAIIPDKVDLSNNNIAYFYFTEAVAGKAVIAGGPLVNTITIKGNAGLTWNVETNTIGFNSSDFYITGDAAGKPVINLQPIAGSGGVTDHGALTGLSDDDHSQYLLASDATSRVAFAANWLDLTDGGETSLHTHPASGGGGGFYGVIFKRTGDVPVFKKDTISFLAADFYLTGDSQGKPVLGLTDVMRTNDAADFGDTQHVHSNIQTHGYLELNIEGAEPGQTVKVVSGVSRTHRLFIHDDTSFSVGADMHGTGLGTPGYRGYRSRGTPAAPTLIRGGDVAVEVVGYGHDGTDYEPVARIRVVADADATNDIAPGRIEFHTSSPTTGILTEAMVIDSDQHVSMQNTLNVKNQVTAEAFYLKTGGELVPLTVKDIDGNPTITNVNTIQFTNGTVTDQGNGIAEVTISAGSGISTLTEGTKSFGSQTVLGVNNVDFYFSPGGVAGNKVLNLKYSDDFLPVFIENPNAQGIAVDPIAPYAYTIESVTYDCISGSAFLGFYIMPASARTARPGNKILGLDGLTVSASLQKAIPTSNNAINPNDKLMVYVFGNAAAKHISILVKAVKS